MSKTTFAKIARAIYRALFGEDAIIVPVNRDLSERILVDFSPPKLSDGFYCTTKQASEFILYLKELK